MSKTDLDTYTYSFDVFDTCLLRNCGFPSAVFQLISHALKDILPPEKITWSEEEFVIQRVRAERLARTRATTEEVILNDIWIHLCKAIGLDYSANWPEIELECERKVLCQNPEILRKINSIRLEGKPVLFISDMYLPYDFVKNELIRHGFFQKQDRLYLSSEIGLTKHSGNLYKYVLEKESLSPKQLHHCGDNQDSDFQVPLNFGINSFHYKDARFTKSENHLILLAQSNFMSMMPIINAMRHYRLSNISSDLSHLVGEFLGPILALFAQWVLQSAEKNGVKHLYFFSRDCQAVSKIAAVLSEKDFGIECRYLLVSRQALFLPSLTDCNLESMPWMFRNFETPTLESLLAKLELNIDKWIARFESLHRGAGSSYIVSGEEDEKLFWSILGESDVNAEVLRIIETRKSAALSYFRKQEILDHDRIGTVDLGWHGTCQAAFKKILDSTSKSISINGYYLGWLTRACLPRSQTGPISALFKQKPIDDPFDSFNYPVFRHITKIEHILGLADHPSVHHYEEGQPIFQHSSNGALNDKARNIKLLHAELEKFANIYNSLRGKNRLNDDFIRLYSGALLSEFWSNPNVKSLTFFRGIYASIDQNNLNPTPLVSPYTFTQALKQFLPRRIFGKHSIPGGNVVPWQEASYKISPKLVKLILKFRIYSSRIYAKVKSLK